MKSLRPKIEIIVVTGVLVIAFLFRFIHLTEYPAGFNADEASFGYDAYSIFTTGADQWGTFLPLTLKSFGDYKSPLYSYLTVPSVGIFGLSVFAVRLPNVIMGTLAVFAVYLLVNEIEKLKNGRSLKLGIIASFLLAINPWHIMLSRGAFEANLITLFLPLGIYFFLKGLEKSKFFAFSALFFGLSLFTYHSAKLLTPLVAAGLLIIFRKSLLKINFKKLLPAILIFLIFFAGLLFTFKTGGGARISERSIMQGALEEGAEQKIKLINDGFNPVLARVLHNKYQVVAGRFIYNYFQYFSYKFLLSDGAGEGYYGMIPGIGVLHVFDLILFLGAFTLFFKKETKWLATVLFLWLLISPLPAALSTGVGYSGTRAEGMLPAFQIIEAFGIAGLLSIFKKTNGKTVAATALILLILGTVETGRFYKAYFRFPGIGTAKSMLYGNLELFEWLKNERGQKNVIVSRSISEPQIFVAFVNKWDPSDFQKQTLTWKFDESGITWVDQLPEWSLGPYLFKSIDWKADGRKKDILIVARPDEVPKGVTPEKVFLYPDGSTAIMVIDPNKKVYAQAF